MNLESLLISRDAALLGVLRPTLEKISVSVEVCTGTQTGSEMLPATWRSSRDAWAALFRTKTRDEWAALLQYTDACVAPVLDWTEAPAHPHLAARETFVTVDDVAQPAPAPRFSRTPGAIQRPPALPGEHTDEILASLDLPPEAVAKLRAGRAVA